MTLAELIRRVRTQSNDTVEPYFWSDQDITDWLNDAVAEACVRGRLVHESVLPDVCVIDVVAGQSVYPLHPALYEITSIIHYLDASPRAEPLRLVSTEWLDANVHDWRELERRPEYAIQGDKGIRLVPRPERGAQLRIEGFRLPIERMKLEEKATVMPEINQAHHIHLIQWAMYQGFSIPDMETFDPARAGKAEAEFENYFGLRPDSDLRRITREDVPHYVEAAWI